MLLLREYCGGGCPTRILLSPSLERHIDREVLPSFLPCFFVGECAAGGASPASSSSIPSMLIPSPSLLLPSSRLEAELLAFMGMSSPNVTMLLLREYCGGGCLGRLDGLLSFLLSFFLSDCPDDAVCWSTTCLSRSCPWSLLQPGVKLLFSGVSWILVDTILLDWILGVEEESPASLPGGLESCPWRIDQEELPFFLLCFFLVDCVGGARSTSWS